MTEVIVVCGVPVIFNHRRSLFLFSYFMAYDPPSPPVFTPAILPDYPPLLTIEAENLSFELFEAVGKFFCLYLIHHT